MLPSSGFRFLVGFLLPVESAQRGCAGVVFACLRGVRIVRVWNGGVPAFGYSSGAGRRIAGVTMVCCCFVILLFLFGLRHEVRVTFGRPLSSGRFPLLDLVQSCRE